jgi:RNA recognition motif-containing protein
VRGAASFFLDFCYFSSRKSKDKKKLLSLNFLIYQMPNKTNIPTEKPFKENLANAHRFGFNGKENLNEVGRVVSVKIVMDRDTGRSKGYGFVEMGDEQEGQSAISGLNESTVDGNQIVVKKARQRKILSKGAITTTLENPDSINKYSNKEEGRC